MSGKTPKDDKNSDSDDCGCYTDPLTKKSCPPIKNVTHPLRYYEFTQEEMKALEECDQESFYKRCLPLSTLFATFTYAAIKAGYLQRNPHFGVFPKIILSAVLGHIFGRLSYIETCDEKLRKELSNDSKLRKLLRKYEVDRNAALK